MLKTFILLTIVGVIIGAVCSNIETARDKQAGTVAGELAAIDNIGHFGDTHTVSLVGDDAISAINLSCNPHKQHCDCDPRVERCAKE